MGGTRTGTFWLRMRFGARGGLALPRSASKGQTFTRRIPRGGPSSAGVGFGALARPKKPTAPARRHRRDVQPSARRGVVRGHVSVRICGGRNGLGKMDDAGPWRAPRRQTRSAVGSPPTERSRPTIASIARRVEGAKFVVLKSFHSLVDVVRGVSRPVRRPTLERCTRRRRQPQHDCRGSPAVESTKPRVQGVDECIT